MFYGFKKFLKSNRIKFAVATVLIIYVLFFSNLPLGFSNILHASEIIGVDEFGNPMYIQVIDEEEPSITEDYSENVSEEPQTFETDLSAKLSTFDPNNPYLILVNKENPLKEDVACELVDYDGFDVDTRILDKLDEMFKAAKADGINLCMASGYRDYNTQKYLYEKKISYFRRVGYSKEEAEMIAATKVTPPLTSEHETGLAVDILSYSYNEMDSYFGDSDAGIWLAEHSYEYGFILRYPQGTEEITGIQYEPWHFRYVGSNAAEYIYVNNLTYEEFYELISEN